jgi:type VI protein secretion system component VasK
VGDEARMLALLDRLRGLPASIDAGSSGLLRVSFGQAEKLTTQARRAYRDALRELLLSHAVYSLERALQASPAREPLEAYLSLYEPRTPDERLLAAVLTQVWNLPPAARGTLPVHLHAALEDRPLALPHSRDDELVEAARRKLGTGARL